jgi:hypothetical protein
MAESETVEPIPAENAAPEAPNSEETPDTNKPEVPIQVKRALQKANKEAETLRLKLKEFEDRDKTEAQKLQERLDAAEAKAAALEIDNLRRDVAADKGLTNAQARRLMGATREELEADADDFLNALPKAGTQYGDVGQGHRGSPTSGEPRDIFAHFIQGRPTT